MPKLKCFSFGLHIKYLASHGKGKLLLLLIFSVIGVIPLRILVFSMELNFI